MKCPRCKAKVLPQQNACNACGFSATLLHGYLGNQWVKLERITDAANCMRLEELRRSELVLDDFERHFPQAFFAIYLGVLPNSLNAAELGFWLLNQGAFNTHSISRRNDFGIVMVVDPATRTASITLGYAIEAFFENKLIQRILLASGGHLAKSAFGAAIESACARCTEVLAKNAQIAAWDPASCPPGTSLDMGLQPLRTGHKQTPRPLAGHMHS